MWANAETGIGYDKREGNKKAGETPCGFFATTARLKSFDLINGFLIGAGYMTKLCVRCLVIINNNIQHYTIDSVYLKIQALWRLPTQASIFEKRPVMGRFSKFQ